MPSRILVVDDSATIRRVVGAILERNGYGVALAEDGQAALDLLVGERKEIFDLVLLDFVMPKMNGYQLCRMIRQHEDVASVPIVLMSAKSDKIRDQFVQQTGAIDAISKPFDAQALVAVIEHALRRVETGRASAAQLPELDPDDPADSSPGSRAAEEDIRRSRVTAEVSGKLSRLIAAAFARTNAGPIDAEETARALATTLDDDALRTLRSALGELDADAGGPVLKGEFGTIPIGAVLQLLQVEGQSGSLAISNGDGLITLTMRGGLIDFVQSRGTKDEFRLGRFFVEEGLVTRVELDTFLKKDPPANRESVPPMSGRFDRASAAPPASGATGAPSTDTNPEGVHAADLDPDTMRLGPREAEELMQKAEAEAEAIASGTFVPTSPDGVAAATASRWLGDRLLAAGRIDEEQLRAALVRQSSELVYELLRWPKGTFEFRRRPPNAQAAAAHLGLTVPAVVMEGFRRVDEWRGLESAVGDFEGVLVQDVFAIGSLPPDKITKPERMVLEAIDGERTLREIIAASHMSSFDACRVLAQLLEARLVRRRVA